MQAQRSIRQLLGQNTMLAVGGLALVLTMALVGICLLFDSPPKAITSTQIVPIKNPAPANTASVTEVTNIATPASDDDATKNAWLDTLAALESTPLDKAAPQILQALHAKDRDVRLRAVSLLSMSKNDPAVLPLLAIAQSDTDTEVRRDAITVLENCELKEDLTPHLARAGADADDEVRSAALQTAWSLSPAQRDDFIHQAINSTHDDISSSAFEMLKHESSTKTVQLLLTVYATNDAAKIEKANDVMNILLNQNFANAAEATTWWQQHQGEYKDDLSLKSADAPMNP